MFFIKFLGKIENILGDASNIFNFTLEFNEKHFNPHFLFLLKTKKTVEKVFGRVTYSGNSYLLLYILLPLNLKKAFQFIPTTIMKSQQCEIKFCMILFWH